MSAEMQEFIRLAPLGFLVGAYGTLVGAGGGSVLVPILPMMLPNESPATVTAISLAVVFFNAYSGTIAYVRMGRVDYRAAVLFTVAGLPGAILGTLLVREVPRRLFDPAFGTMLVALGAFLVISPLGGRHTGEPATHVPTSRNDLLGAIGSGYIGVLSSLLGIGGGIIHVPFLIRGLGFPAHVATATSHFVLTFMALAASVTHVIAGEFNRGLLPTLSLAVGVMMGAPVGAAASTRLQGSFIVRMLAMALSLVGLRLLSRYFW
jgi:uncharacterized membrane protein YfcA